MGHDRTVLTASRTDRAAWANAAYDVAWRILHDRDAATTSAIHGVGIDAIADPASAMLIASRRRALELLTSREGARPGVHESGGVAFVHDAGSNTDEVTAADQAWGAVEAMGPLEASLVDLHLRFGVPAGTLADELETDPEHAADHLERLRGRLEGALASWRLWNDGHPRCDDLTAQLNPIESPSFDPTTGREIAKHAVGCELCRSNMTDGGAGGLDAFVHAPVLRAPAAVHDAVPKAHKATVFVDAERAGESGASRSEPDQPTERGVDVDPDVGGPGLFAGIILGIVLSVVIVAGVTAWVITSG